MINEWVKAEHALEYLRRLEDIPHRKEGEATLIAEIPKYARRILDLGCGDGHLLALLLAHCDEASGVGLDFSPTMLKEAERRFVGEPRAKLLTHISIHLFQISATLTLLHRTLRFIIVPMTEKELFIRKCGAF
jgi:trans-aconitate methyltransferase